MKNKFLIGLCLTVILFSACQKEENMYTPDSIAQSEAMKKSKAVANLDSSVNDYPQIRFKFGGKNNQLVRVVLFDSLFKNYDDLKVDVEVLPHINSDSEKEASTVKPYVKTTAYAQVGVDLYMLRSEPVPYTESFIGKIVDVRLTLISNGQKVDSRSFSVFVFENGKSALQKPTLKVNNNDRVGRWIQTKADELANSATYSITVENDPAEQVAAVEVVFDEKTASPAPISYTNYLKRKFKYGQHMIFSSVLSFSENPVGFTYSTSITLLDAKGNTIGQTVTTTTEIQKADFTGRIKRVRIRETGGSMNEYRIAAVIENVNDKRFDFVEVKFNEPFKGPKPNQSEFKMRKRPELLVSEWDNVIDNYITEIQNNPLSVAGNDPSVNPLFFEKPAVGYTYSVTTTIYNKNGKVMGEPQTFEVTVEGETDNTEPVVQSTRLFSTDGGKTWNYEAVIQDNGQWVEKVQVEFVKPYEGPAPVYNPIGLSLVATKEGNIKMYSGKVEFLGDPFGFNYTAIIQQFGTGTRTTATQANSKAELL
ncbi:MAG: hypothetical protein AB9846_08385 [Tenuifilaceae bacterium]